MLTRPSLPHDGASLVPTRSASSRPRPFAAALRDGLPARAAAGADEKAATTTRSQAERQPQIGTGVAGFPGRQPADPPCATTTPAPTSTANPTTSSPPTWPPPPDTPPGTRRCCRSCG